MSIKLTALKNLRKGSFASARIVSIKKTLKGVTEIVTKQTLVTVNTGINYNHQKDVIYKRASGELPAEPQPLPWGVWTDYPYEISHKDTRYLRVYIKGCPRVAYFIDGKQVTKAKAQLICRAFDSYVYVVSLGSFLKAALTVSSAGKAKALVKRFGGEFKKVVKISKPDCITPREESLVSLRQHGKELF